jgi:hypothetical protein
VSHEVHGLQRDRLAVRQDAPVEFRATRLKIALDTDASENDRARLLALTERDGVVSQTLTHGGAVTLERCAGGEGDA